MTDEPLTICPECGGTIRRVLYPAGIVFKGSGFYKTDHHASGSVADSNGHAHKSEDGKAAESTESKTSTTSESKPTSTGEKSTGGERSAKSENKVASPTK
jgi:predicted nucleic acid-binding Zn ribbon protein